MPTEASRPAHVISIEDVMGLWRASPRSGPGECRVSLSRQPLGEAYGVNTEACSLPLFAKAVTWRPVAGGFQLQDQDGRSLIAFRQTGVDGFVAVDEAYRLERAPLG